jgi:pyrroline-5-carboxylate reductase
VNAAERDTVDTVVATTGERVWVDAEAQLDVVTALSGSGPAYVFYFLEAMREAGTAMGLPPDVAQRLATGTFIGAATLAQRSAEPLHTLRERVTSKGGTTHAALSSMEASGVKQRFIAAMQAAEQRAAELGREFGG